MTTDEKIEKLENDNEDLAKELRIALAELEDANNEKDKYKDALEDIEWQARGALK